MPGLGLAYSRYPTSIYRINNEQISAAAADRRLLNPCFPSTGPRLLLPDPHRLQVRPAQPCPQSQPGWLSSVASTPQPWGKGVADIEGGQDWGSRPTGPGSHRTFPSAASVKHLLCAWCCEGPEMCLRVRRGKTGCQRYPLRYTYRCGVNWSRHC